MKYNLPYGETSVQLDLGDALISGVLRGRPEKSLDDIKASVIKALDNPIQSKPLKQLLKEGMHIALVVSDMSRYWMRQDLVIPHVVKYLEDSGIADDGIKIIVANGTHSPGGEADLRKLVTDAVYDRIKTLNHDCMASDMVEIGTTSRKTRVEINAVAANADLVICLGAATHHVMAGFGGGRKSIVPGIASLQTIYSNHAWCLDEKEFKSNPLIGNGKLDGNPMNEDALEAAGMMKNLFMINLVMNSDMRLCDITAGDYLNSWLKACERVDGIYKIEVPKKADIIIASCGGFPKDMSLYQGTKAIDNIEDCLKPGGILVLSIEARDQGGPEEYFGWIKNLVEGTQEKRLRSAFTVAGYIFLLNTEQAKRYDIRMLTSIKPEVLAPMGIKAYSDPKAVLEGIDFKGKVTYVIPNATTVMPHVSETKEK